MRVFLSDLTSRELIVGYIILKNRDTSAEVFLLSYQIIAKMQSDEMGKAFADVEKIGIWKGLHGAMIRNVDTFKVQFLDEC